MVYNLVSLKPEGFAHHPSFFDDTIDAVANSIEQAGNRVVKTTNRIAVDAINIVWGVGTHLFPSIDTFRRLASPKNTVVFNMEQIGSDSALVTREYLSLLKDYVVLDYNQQNIEALNKKVGSVCRAYEFPVRPSYALNRFSGAPGRVECDALFYGAMSQRRLKILQKLQSQGLRVRIARGFGEELSRQIMQSKVVLNIHLHDTAIFEVARVLRPISHGVPVLSEVSVLPTTVSWEKSGVEFFGEKVFVERLCESILKNDECVRWSRQAVWFSSVFESEAVNQVLNNVKVGLDG